MATAAPKPIKQIGESKAVANHDHDMIHELGKRIDAVWRFDQSIANAEGKMTNSHSSGTT